MGKAEEPLTFPEPQSVHVGKGGRRESACQVCRDTACNVSTEEAEAGDTRVEGPAGAT